jgi:chemotaxis methyl-accepting protein methylase
MSFLPEQEQTKLIAEFSDKLKNRGVVFMGRNEMLSGVLWQTMADDPISAYMHIA